MERRHTTLVIIFCVLAAILVAAWAVLPVNTLLGDRGGNTDTSNPALTINTYAAWEQADRCFILDVANTKPLRRQGLSGRRSLAPNRGMLFLYSISAEYGYWMKDMNFPIDIIWLDKNDQITTIASKVSPDTYPEVLYPTDSARKVIEVSAGVVDELGLKTGDTLNVSEPTTTPPVDCAML